MNYVTSFIFSKEDHWLTNCSHIVFNNRHLPIFTSPEATNCFSIITLMIIRENKTKKKNTFLKDFGALKCPLKFCTSFVFEEQHFL